MLPLLTERFGNPSGAHRPGPRGPPGARRGPRRVAAAARLPSRARSCSPAAAPRPTTSPSPARSPARWRGRVLGHRAPRRAATPVERRGGRVVAVDAARPSSTSTRSADALDDDVTRRVGDAGQQRGRHDPAARRGRRASSASGAPRRGAAHRCRAGGRAGSTSPRRGRAPTWCRSAPTSSAGPRASARSSCATRRRRSTPLHASAAARSASAAAAPRTSPASSAMAAALRAHRRPSGTATVDRVGALRDRLVDGLLDRRARRGRETGARRRPHKVAGSCHLCIDGRRERGAAVPARRGRRVRLGRRRRAPAARMEPSHVLAAMGVDRATAPAGRCGCRSAGPPPTPTSTAPLEVGRRGRRPSAPRHGGRAPA